MSPSSQSRYCFVIPIYNHYPSVWDVIRKVQKTGFPLILVDDGSTDEMAGIDIENDQRLTGVIFLRHPENRGKGAALLTGLTAAAKISLWAITVDADGQHFPADHPSLLRAVSPGTRPIVVGSRLGMDNKTIPWTSRHGRKFSNFWVRLAGGPKISDTQSGFRLYPLPETLNLAAHARRFQFEVEILVKARWSGMPVVEAPVSVHYQPGTARVSHFRPFVDFMRNTAVFSRLIFQRILFHPATRQRRGGP
jgi:glycosyltransferase involved in cell wall biosynthesis